MRTCSRHLPAVWLAALLLLSGSVRSGSAAVGTSGIQLAPATPGAVRFTVRTPASQLTRVDFELGSDQLELTGFDALGAPGTPGTWSRTVLVAVPPLGEVRVSAAASDLRISDGVLLAARPRLDREGNVTPAMRDLAAYGAAGSASPVAARLLEVTWMRNQRVARVELLPVAYEPALRRLTVAGRIDVEVAVTNLGALSPAAEPVDPFEKVYSLSVLNYEQGRSWRRPAPDVLRKAALRAGIPIATVGTATAVLETTSVFARRTWIKIAIQKTGFYAVNFSRLRGLSLFGPQAARLDSLRMFTWPGRTVLPEGSYCDSCDYREVALGLVRDVGLPEDPAHPEIDGPADGLFSSNNDAVYFFAQAANGWDSDMDASRPDTSFVNHQYDRNSYYYLTFSPVDTDPTNDISSARYPVPPQRIDHSAADRRDVTPGGTEPETVVATVPGRLHLEQDNEYWPDASALGSTLAWEKFFWRSLTAGPGFTHSLDIPDADATQPARFRLRQWGLSISSCQLPDHFLDVSFNGVVFPRRDWRFFRSVLDQAVTFDTTGVFLRTAGNQLSVEVPVIPPAGCDGRVDRSGLAFYEIYYERKLIPVEDAIEFRARPGVGRLRYDIGPFVNLPSSYVFDITDPIRPVRLTGTNSVAGSAGYTLSFTDTATVSHRYIVVPDSVVERSSALLPATSLSDAVVPVDKSLRNLRSPENGADYLVIHYDAFVQAADSLATWRREHLPLLSTPAPHQVLTVPVSVIYDQFSGGRTDPGAIRNFLRAAYNWSRRPLYVTFLGDASFDFKDITGRAVPGQPGCLLPTFENNYDGGFQILRQYATDDWMVNVDDPNIVLPDYLTGRIPANDAVNALAVVTGKILGYERSAPFGEYRNAAILMADDDAQGNDRCDSWIHLSQTTALDTARTPNHIDRQYVYLHTFPSGLGGTKPGARSRLLSDLDGGASFFNYVGHGSPVKMSDEGVFLESDAGSLSNGLRLSLMVAASCDVGKFNDPTVQSVGERMFMAASGGSIAVVSATELALSTDNSRLNGLIYDALFTRDTLTVGAIELPGEGQYHVPVSAALLSAKSAPSAQSVNSRKYQLLGDPATLLNLPKLWSELTLTDANDQPVSQLRRGQTVRFRGRVVDRPGGSAVPMDGVASLVIEDSAPDVTTPLQCGRDPKFPDGGTEVYRFSAGPMYRGDVSLAAGVFNGRFVVPMDATVGAYGRVRAYMSGATAAESATDGVGDLRVQVSTGIAPAGDTQGPRVTLSFVGGSTSVRPDATLKIDLFDDNGIMTTGHAPQNSIIVTLDDNTTTRVDATGTFRYAADSHQSGTATFQLPGLAPGAHTIKVSAADNLATGIDAVLHRSSATLAFQVVNTPPLRVVRTYLFPTPVRSGGKGSGGVFVVDAPGDSVNTLIRVYAVTGKLVRSLRLMGGIGQVQAVWDGLDDEGDPLAQGTYLYKVHVSVRDADGKSSARQRATAEGRFVVLSP